MSDKIFQNTAIREWMAAIKEGEPEVLSFQKKMALTESPTFEEAQRGAVIKELFQDMGLEDVSMDDIGNVYGTLPGNGLSVDRESVDRESVVIEAHMDTVFPKGTAREVKEENGIYHCPGISDNTRGIAVLYGLLRIFRQFGIRTEKDIIFLATVREEGIGGCSGIKYFLEHCGSIACCISIDGPDADVIIHGGCGIKTIEVKFRGRGGHAYNAYGKVGNPVHAAVRAMNRIVALPLPPEPRTTCVISGFHAGTEDGIHATPAEASLTLNFRSEDQQELIRLEKSILAALELGVSEENAFTGGSDIDFEVVRHVDIPAVHQPTSSQIVRAMSSAMEFLNLKPIFDCSCPTNASVTMGKGIPGICIGGGGKAGDNHSLQEWYDPVDSHLGVQSAFLGLLILAGLQQ